MRIIAVDWSGAKTGAEKKIWLAEAVAGRLLRLECGRSRSEVADHLVDLSRTDADIVAGFDFAFSLPAWYLDANGWSSAPAMWAAAALEGETWMRSNPPFWGGAYGRRPAYAPGQDPYRGSDLLLKIGSIRPKSVFQVGGGGSVGMGSLRGWPVLHRLSEAGFAIWPFDPSAMPLAVEIYPRLLTGQVNKSSAIARESYITQRLPAMPAELAGKAIASDDAFDAAVSAIIMSENAGHLTSLPAQTEPAVLMEGMIWHPALFAAAPSGEMRY